MTVNAAALGEISGSITLDQFDRLLERLRENATAVPAMGMRGIYVTWVAPDPWQLRGLVEETILAVEDFIDFPEREPAGDGSGTDIGRFSWWDDNEDRLSHALSRLRDRGYQPSYNGRPSCPFCSAFVDGEQTHSEECILLVPGIIK